MEQELLMGCSLAVLIISVLILSTLEGMNKEEEKPLVDLAICILSARNNVDLRNSIRQSWLSDIEKMARPDGKQWSISARFVIGSNSCDIHPDNRVSTYNCNRWNFSLPADPSKELVLFSTMPSQVGGRRNIVSSYMIKTMHSITLKRVGILELFPFDKIPKSANIVLYDSASQEEIRRTKFSHNGKGNLINGYYYKSMEELYLPKNYEFTMHLEISEDQDYGQVEEFLESIMGDVSTSGTSSGFREQHHGLLIVKFLHGTHYSVDANDDPRAVSLLSLIFTINDVGQLRQISEASDEKDMSWRREVNQEAISLAKEAASHGDVLLADMMDVYRNLPQKLLLCHQWFFENHKARFVLKTDDDCFVNIPSVITLTAEKYNDSELIWVGNFRRSWMVERHGKWKEERYTAPAYPDFACGSGNLVSRPVHRILATSRQSLNLFQGEDVSMGVWMSAFDVRRIQDSRWRCTHSCADDMLTLPQLNAESITWYWNNTKRCPSPCKACT